MNYIYINQNKEYFLMLQYSQRKYYDMAEKIQYIIWIFIIFNIIINNNAMINNFYGENIVKIISCVLTALYAFLRSQLNRSIEIGAYTKEVIDCTLFDLDIKENLKKFTEEQLNEFAIRKKEKNKTDYLCQINNTGKDIPRGIKNWYEDKQEMNIGNAIYEYQKENIWWDGKLSKIYMILFTVVSLVAISLMLIININESVKFLLFTVVIPSAPILSELIFQGIYLVKLMVYQGKVEVKCKGIEKNISNIDKEDLEELQELILQRRLYKFLIPSRIHSMLSKKFHELREAMTQAKSIKM